SLVSRYRTAARLLPGRRCNHAGACL
ncbi:uncharacterized protein METZ01_LOCUS204637, partial [marine metagenome]